MNWTLRGEAGKALDATEKTLADVHAKDTEVRFANLAEDSMTWTAWLSDIAQVDTLIPEWGQRVTLYRDGARYFTGHVTDRVPRFSAGRWGYSIKVSGPWYWLNTTPLESDTLDQAELEKKRAMFVFPQDTVKNHLITLASLAISLGVPIALGSVANCFLVPRLTLREMSLAEAISEMMRWVADGMVYFDYSGADNTLPRLCMQRRNEATQILITPSMVTVPELNLRPRIDLKVTQVSLKFAKRQTVGDKRVTVWDLDETAVSAAPLPSRQILTTAGPELDTFLPNDFTDSVVVRSRAIQGNIGDAVAQWNDILRSAGATDLTAYSVAESDNAVGVTSFWPRNPLISVTDNDGNNLDLNVWNRYLTKGEIKDWFAKDGIQAINARVSATIATSVIRATTDPAPPTPLWARVLEVDFYSHFINRLGFLEIRYVWEKTVSSTVPLVKTLWAADTTLIRQEDWGWVNPPAGLAQNLLETQNWLPFEGQLPIALDEIPAGNAVGSVINVGEWVPECATMKALISGYSVTPRTGQITYTLGSPARHAYRDIVTRFRQSGADNIFYLGGA